MWNARLWAGTRDDWVWTDDSNTKTRGNLVGGGFAPLASPADACNALVVSNSINETVLFYSTTPGADMVWNSCCSFGNAYNQNPATNAVQSSVMDGSYATTLRLGDLEPGQSSTINCESSGRRERVWRRRGGGVGGACPGHSPRRRALAGWARTPGTHHGRTSTPSLSPPLLLPLSPPNCRVLRCRPLV